jgi:hypothetical protein
MVSGVDVAVWCDGQKSSRGKKFRKTTEKKER